MPSKELTNQTNPGLEQNRRTFIQLLVSSIQLGSYPAVRIPEKVFIDYLELTGERERYWSELKKEFEGISKKQFRKQGDPVQDVQKELLEGIEALERICRRTNTGTPIHFVADLVESDHTSRLIRFYYKKTGVPQGKPVKMVTLSDAQIYEFDEKCSKLGEKALKSTLLREVRDQLSFQSYYSSQKKEAVNKCADACWSLYNELTDHGKKEIKVNRKEFRDTVLRRFHVKRYERYSPKVAKKKKKDAVSQWIRDVKKTNNIIIPK